MESDLLFALSLALVVLGASILFGSLFLFRRVNKLLPKGKTKKLWSSLLVLNCLFLLGYIGYTIFLLISPSFQSSDVIVGLVFLFGALFVWLTNKIMVGTLLNVRRIEKLKAESIIDPLTGIFNRRYFFRRLQEEIEKSKRYRMPLSLAIFDIDNFKDVNDTCGHLIGDKVLTQICEIIQSSARKVDIVARYGGEEVCLLMPNTKVSKAKLVADRIREKIYQTEFILEKDGKTVKVKTTVSVGISSFSKEMSPKELLSRADDNLYKAKRAGKNKVVADEDADSLPKAQTETLTEARAESLSDAQSVHDSLSPNFSSAEGCL